MTNDELGTPRRALPPHDELAPTDELNLTQSADDDDDDPTLADEDSRDESVGEAKPVGYVEPQPVESQPAPSNAATTSTKPRRKISLLTVVGLLLLALGLGSLGYIGWQYYGTNIVANQEAAKGKEILKRQFAQQRKSPQPTAMETGADGKIRPKTPLEGDWIALLRIPALGNDWEWPIIAGTSPDVLAKGVGWYRDSAQPGQIGNFALAGHRITHGEPFARLLELNVGDKVIVETRDAIYTYQLYTAPRDLTVKDTDVWVIDPVPGKKGVAPTEALLTLTTCTNLFATPERSVAFGRLIDKQKP